MHFLYIPHYDPALATRATVWQSLHSPNPPWARTSTVQPRPPAAGHAQYHSSSCWVLTCATSKSRDKIKIKKKKRLVNHYLIYGIVLNDPLTLQINVQCLLKKVPVALLLTSQWCFNDVRVQENWILQILNDSKIGQISNFCQKSKECVILMEFLANCERKWLKWHTQEVSSTW